MLLPLPACRGRISGMAQLRRRWRILKWMGLVLSLLIVVGFCHSAVAALRLNVLANGMFALQITSTWGSIDFASLWPTSNSPTNLSVNWWDNTGWGLLKQRGWQYVVDIVFRWPGYERILPNTQAPGQCGVTTIMVPYWTLFSLVAIPTAFLCWLDHRRIPPGHCQNCGYNLTGNISGICPECGAVIHSK